MKEHNKTRAFLLEFIIVILFFSVSAVITLQLFANANNKSESNNDMINAVVCAQSVAENIRAEVSVYNEEGIYTRYLDDELNYVEDNGYYEETVIVSIVDDKSSEIGTLYEYEIIISNASDNNEIFSLTISKYISKEVLRWVRRRLFI